MGTYIKQLKPFEEKFDVKKEGLTITVSGLAGSGKTTFAKALANTLGLKYVSAGEIFRNVAKEMSVDIETLSKIRSSDLDLKVDIRTLEYAKRGNVVLDGRLTGWVAGDIADLRIWVECSMKKKAERVAKREGISSKEAEKRLIERDESDIRAYREVYGINLYETDIYDLVIDNTNLTYEELTKENVEKVKTILKEKGLI